MKRIIKNLIKSIAKKELFILICAILICISSKDTYALTSTQYDRFVEDGRLGNLNIEVNAKGQMFRKFGHFIIDGQYSGGDKNPFYNAENSRDLAVLAVTEDSVYDVYGEIEYEEIDYSYEDDEELNATEYDRAAFEARVNGMEYGNTLKKSIGYGKYNLRPGKNLTAFIKFAYDFYKNNSGEVRVGCKNVDDLISRGLSVDKICPMEELEAYAEKNYISTDTADDVDLKRIWKECTEKWEYEGSLITNKENIFEHLQDIFMCYVYLKPGIDKIKSVINISKLDEADYGAILSMMYERFGGRPISPDKVESGKGIPVIGKGDVLAALVDLSNTELSNMSVADKIYTYMIEVKYKNNDLKLASWLKEAELVNGGYSILTAKDYDIYMKAYNEAFQKYGSDTANDTLLDYGCVLTPDIFESKKSFSDARNEFAKTIKKYFGNSSFYKNTGNENYVARSYMMAKKMCENSQFSDITDIYACDMDVVSHTYGYDSSNIILLADTQVVQLNDSYGQDCDTDQDGILDYKEAHTAEEVDITSFLEVYCKYNKYSEEEKNEMLLKNGKVVMYNYSSNPVLPDSDFDGRDDLRDGKKLDNEYNSINETDNYSGIKIKYNQDYRYFFMDSTKYYQELAEMGLVLSNMASKKKKNNRYINKTWTNNNIGEHYTVNSINDYMWYIGMDNIVDHMEEEVPYIIGQHDTIGLLGKVNNLERNVITLVIGENENYKDILAANYDGTLDKGSGNEIHHQGYDYYADKIYEKLVDYDIAQNADRWKKSYWITGYGTGGAVANLVAKKFIDYKHVNTNVYCYTYQAPGTINRNNISSEKKIHNTKYYSIFNHINIDDPLVFLEGDNFDRYGRDKKVAAGYTNDFHNKTEYGKDMLYNNLNESLVRLLMDYELNNEVNGMIKGFSFVDDFSNLKNNIDIWQNFLLLKGIPEIEITNIFLKGKEIQNWIISLMIKNKFINAILSSTDAKYQREVIDDDDEIGPKPEITTNANDCNENPILSHIIKMAKFYINNIPTHDTTIQSLSATTKALLYQQYLINVENHPFNIYEYPDAINITDINAPNFYSTTEEAIIPMSGKYIYYYDGFKDLITEEQKGVFNNWENGVKTEVEKNFNVYAHYVGNDCTGFPQAVIYDMEREKGSNNPRGQNGIMGACYGLYNHNDYAGLYSNNSKTTDVKDRFRNFEVALMNLGYVRYDAKDMSIEKLQPGDLLCANDHIEYYVGNNYISNFYDNTLDREKNKKTGVDSVIIEGENTKTKKKIVVKDNKYILEELFDVNGKHIPAAQGTFGWGAVHDEFPVENKGGEMHFFKKSSDNKYFQLYTSWNGTDGKKYTSVWRYERW